VLSLLYCAILATVLTTWLQTNVQRHTHPVRAGVIFSLEPIFASIIALFSVQESWTMRQGAGAGVLLAAVIIPDVIMARREQR
jgi:drug/metabolite transporter (DMT)-like permease